MFEIPRTDLRVITHDVGGGFGMKAGLRRLRRPALCRAQARGRSNGPAAGSKLSRHPRPRRRAGRRAGGRRRGLLSLRVNTAVGMGAYLSTFGAIFATMNTKNCLSSVYAIPAISIGVKMVFPMRCRWGPTAARSAEAIYLIERLIDEAARLSGIDGVELRRKNLIPAAAMPYKRPTVQSTTANSRP